MKKVIIFMLVALFSIAIYSCTMDCGCEEDDVFNHQQDTTWLIKNHYLSNDKHIIKKEEK